jgi:formylglycine-generating enzyme required for sulfatase activity
VTGIETSDERPRHWVTLTRSFWMSETAISQKVFAEQMGQNPSQFKTGRGRKRVDLNRWPIDRVQWPQAVEFYQKLREADPVGLYRLPAEAEWEYACRAGTTSRFAYGERSDHQACNFDNQVRQPVAVDAYAPNAWGLYPMHGNMWEWCADWHARTFYAESPQENPLGPEHGTYRITRGGGWGATEGRTTASARGIARPESRFDCIGFRVVREWESGDADLIRRRFP